MLDALIGVPIQLKKDEYNCLGIEYGGNFAQLDCKYRKTEWTIVHAQRTSYDPYSGKFSLKSNYESDITGADEYVYMYTDWEPRFTKNIYKAAKWRLKWNGNKVAFFGDDGRALTAFGRSAVEMTDQGRGVAYWEAVPLKK